MKNILFICSANKDRSKTAEDHFSENYSNLNFDSAGTNKKTCNKLRTNYLEEEQLRWAADRIFVMEKKHWSEIKSTYGSEYSYKIKSLNIRDIYKYGDRELIQILENKLSSII